MPMLPTFSLLSPFRESIAENGRSIKNGGHPWGGRMYGPSLFCGAFWILSKQDAVRTIRALIGTDGAKVLRLFADQRRPCV